MNASKLALPSMFWRMFLTQYYPVVSFSSHWDLELELPQPFLKVISTILRKAMVFSIPVMQDLVSYDRWQPNPQRSVNENQFWQPDITILRMSISNWYHRPITNWVGWLRNSDQASSALYWKYGCCQLSSDICGFSLHKCCFGASNAQYVDAREIIQYFSALAS